MQTATAEDTCTIVDRKEDWLDANHDQEEDIYIEIDLSQIVATLPAPPPIPQGMAGGRPPKKEFDLPAAEAKTFRPKFLYMARCKYCGWPGPNTGVELFSAYSRKDAAKHAKELHDDAWSEYDDSVRCHDAPSVKYISSENEDF